MSKSQEIIFRLPGNYYVDLKKHCIFNDDNPNPEYLQDSLWRTLEYLIEHCNEPVLADEMAKNIGITLNTLRKNIKTLKRMATLGECIPRGRDGTYLLRQPLELSVNTIESDALEREEKHSTYRIYNSMPIQECVLQNTPIQKTVGFVSHTKIEQIFDCIDSSFEAKNKAFFLYGMGGIGKTTIARQYAVSRSDKFSTIVFSQIDTDIKGDTIENAIVNDGTFVLSGFVNRNDYFSRHNRRETDSEYFERKLSKIKQIADEHTLIVLDNLDSYSASRLQDVLSGGNYRVLVTTRIDVSSFGFPFQKVPEIRDVEYAKQVFFSKIGNARHNIDRNDSALAILFEKIDYHILTIELLAKVLAESNHSPSAILRMITDDEGLAGIKTRIPNSIDTDTKTPMEWISRIFDLSVLEANDLWEESKVILSYMVLMPTRGIDKQIFMSWLTPELQNALNFLIRRSWIRSTYDETSETISMHPVIKEVVLQKITPSLAQIRPIINGMANDINILHDWIYHAPIEQKQKYTTIVSAVYQAFSQVDLNYFDFYTCVLKVYHLCRYRANGYNCQTIVHNIKNAVEEAGDVDSWRYGYVLFQLGEINSSVDREAFKGMEDFLKAEPIMRGHSKNNAEKLQLATLYRTMVATHSRLLYETNGEYCPEKVNEYARKGLDIIEQLKSSGEDSLRIRNYPGTIHVWQSKAGVFTGDLIAAKENLRKAYDIFQSNGFPNEMDRCALLDIESQIAEKEGNYPLAIQKLLDSIQVYQKGFQGKQKTTLYRYCTLADLYLADHQWENAVNTLRYCEELMCELYEHGSDRRVSLGSSIAQKLTLAMEHLGVLEKM